jgi:hypothetical protein
VGQGTLAHYSVADFYETIDALALVSETHTQDDMGIRPQTVPRSYAAPCFRTLGWGAILVSLVQPLGEYD